MASIQVLENRPLSPAPTTIWRYMDVMKYVDLLESSLLFLAPLTSMSDKWEGAAGPHSALEDEINNLMISKGISRDQATTIVQSAEIMSQQDRGRAYINCWNSSTNESAAMWNIYAGQGKGIAIQSRADLLISSFTDTTGLFLVPVQYKNFEKSTTNYSPLELYTTKRESYSFEQELRVIRYDVLDRSRPMTEQEIKQYHPDQGRETILDSSLRPQFYRYQVRLEDLITAVVVHPGCPNWVYEDKRSLTKRYGYHFQVKRSSLESNPSYLRYRFD